MPERAALSTSWCAQSPWPKPLGQGVASPLFPPPLSKLDCLYSTALTTLVVRGPMWGTKHVRRSKEMTHRCHLVINKTGRTVNCTDWRTDHTLRGDTRQSQPRATATAETLVENHGTTVGPAYSVATESWRWQQ